MVEGTAERWTPTDIATARLIGDTVTDVVLQFRAVRMLIALDQLEQVRRQVGAADQPAVVADAEGRILLANAAFGRLLPRQPGGPAGTPGRPAAAFRRPRRYGRCGCATCCRTAAAGAAR